MSYLGIIIAAKAAMNSGKTTAVLNVWEWLKEQNATKIREEIHEVHDTGKPVDVTAVLEYQGVRIGISSKGDPGIDQEGNLNGFIKNGCRVIVCACRTWGQTKEPIDALQGTWCIHYIVPAEDGFISKDVFLDEVKMVIQEGSGEKKITRTVWKVGSRWDENGSSEAKIADIFERYNVAFAYTDDFLKTKPGDLLAIGDGDKIVAIGIILSPANILNQLNIAMSDEDKKRINFADNNIHGCIVRYHWFKDYLWLANENLKKSMIDLKSPRISMFCHAPSIEEKGNSLFDELERLKGLTK